MKKSIEKQSDLSLSQQIYQDLRYKLRTGKYKVGQRISEIDICDIYDVSRTPAREALRALNLDGFLATSSGGGRMEVAEIDLTRAEQIYDMREAVECLAAKLATKNAKTPDLIELEKILIAQRKGSDTEENFLNINDSFHGFIYNLSKNDYVIRSANILLDSSCMIRGSTYGRYDFDSWSLEDHENIFDAITSGNTAEAERTMLEHIRRGRWQRIKLLSSGD